jgi:hypothetical protein
MSDFLCCLRVLFLVLLVSTSVLTGRLPWRRFPAPLRALNVPLAGSDLRAEGLSPKLSDQEWACPKTHIPASKPLGRLCTHTLRDVFNGIFYILRSGCPWRLLPRDFPPWPNRLPSLQKLPLERSVAPRFQGPAHRRETEGGQGPRRLRGHNRLPERQDNRGSCEIKRPRCPQEYRGSQATPAGGHLGFSALGLRYARRRPRPRRSAFTFLADLGLFGAPPEEDLGRRSLRRRGVCKLV